MSPAQFRFSLRVYDKQVVPRGMVKHVEAEFDITELDRQEVKTINFVTKDSTLSQTSIRFCYHHLQ